MRLYLDANAFIAAVEGELARDQLQSILEAADNRSAAILTSELSLAETLTGPIKSMRLSDNAIAADFFVSYSNMFSDASRIETHPIDKWVLLRAAELRAESTGLKLPDAIHLATAIMFGCGEIVTGDKKLQKAAVACGLKACSLMPADLDALLARIASST